MRKTLAICLIIGLFYVAISCSGIGKDDVAKVWEEYIDLKIKDLQNDMKTNDAVLQQKAARKFKYKGWGDFVNKGSQSLGVEEWNRVSREKSRELGKRLGDIARKKRGQSEGASNKE